MKTTLLAAPPPAGPLADHAGIRRLLACGMAAGPLFVAAFLVQGALRAGYDPMRHPVSSLALGESGWVQSTVFVLAGVLTLLLAAGLRRAYRVLGGPKRGTLWGPLLVGVWGAGLVCAGLFTTDPVSGYPAGTPDRLVQYGSAQAALHDLLSLAGFAALAAACVVSAVRAGSLRRRGWALYSLATGVAFTVAMALATAGFNQVPALVDVAGLGQRIAVVAGFAWLTMLAGRVRGRLRAQVR